MGYTAFFNTIHVSYYTISANFYLYLQYFQQKIFSFNKINRSQTDPYNNLKVQGMLVQFTLFKKTTKYWNPVTINSRG